MRFKDRMELVRIYAAGAVDPSAAYRAAYAIVDAGHCSVNLRDRLARQCADSLGWYTMVGPAREATTSLELVRMGRKQDMRGDNLPPKMPPGERLSASELGESLRAEVRHAEAIELRSPRRVGALRDQLFAES